MIKRRGDNAVDGGRYDEINYLETIGLAAIYISHGSKGVQYACARMYKCSPPKTDSDQYFSMQLTWRSCRLSKNLWISRRGTNRFINLNKTHCLFKKAFSDLQLRGSSSFCFAYKTLKISIESDFVGRNTLAFFFPFFLAISQQWNRVSLKRNVRNFCCILHAERGRE